MTIVGRPIPQILLIHANEINSIALGEMLDRLERRGYELIALSQALEDDAYATPDEYVGRWGISWFHRWRHGRGLRTRKISPRRPASDACQLEFADGERESRCAMSLDHNELKPPRLGEARPHPWCAPRNTGIGSRRRP